jgi:septal ring factor EnvC (AmiA/AmiB activator)
MKRETRHAAIESNDVFTYNRTGNQRIMEMPMSSSSSPINQSSAQAPMVTSPPSAPTPASSPTSAESASPAAPSPDDITSSELKRLRDILYGSQSRVTEKRLGELDTQLDQLQRELGQFDHEKLKQSVEVTTQQLMLTRRDVGERLEHLAIEQTQQVQLTQQQLAAQVNQQSLEQSAQLRAFQRQLSERVEQQLAEYPAQVRAIHKELNERIDKLAADFLTQLRNFQKDASDRLEKQNAEQLERIRMLYTETRQRDDQLRQELSSLTSSLDDKKASRFELGQMLIELGQRLRDETSTYRR